MISPLLQWLAAAVHEGASRMIYNVLLRDMHAATVMSPEITLWWVRGLPGPPTSRIIPHWCHTVTYQRRTSCQRAVLWSCNTAMAAWVASPAVFKGASFTWSRPPRGGNRLVCWV